MSNARCPAMSRLVYFKLRIMRIGISVAMPLLCISLAADAAERGKKKYEVPLGLPTIIWPADNPYSEDKALLGRRLFVEKRLSRDGSISCASCHDPDRAFTDGRSVSIGIGNRAGTRSAPTIINRAYGKDQFWDGRAASLEEQVEGPIRNSLEMDNSLENCVQVLQALPDYVALFERAFGSREITFLKIAQSIATFERTVLSGNSPYDRYKAGDRKALSESAQRGERVFFRKAKCDQCHFGSNFTDGGFANIGIGMDQPNPDLGRYNVLGRAMDWGAFKIPTLREIARTSPYMHDGSLRTLEEVVEHYDRGGTPNRNLDRRYRPLNLTAREKADLVDFLRSLNGEGWQHSVAARFTPSTQSPD